MKYYLGGYFLMNLKPVNFGTEAGNLVYTCSECINDSLISYWSYSWTTDNAKQEEELKEVYGLSEKNISAIRAWVDQKHNEGIIGWSNVFTDLQTAMDYKSKFLSHLDGIHIFALYFEENEAQNVITEFEPGAANIGEIGLRLALSQKKEELEDTSELTLGYDLIGIEGGGDFHTFHCHDIGSELCNKFNLTINGHRLFEQANDWKPIGDYMNDEDNGFEPVPWFVVKVKLVTET